MGSAIPAFACGVFGAVDLFVDEGAGIRDSATRRTRSGIDSAAHRLGGGFYDVFLRDDDSVLGNFPHIVLQRLGMRRPGEGKEFKAHGKRRLEFGEGRARML